MARAWATSSAVRGTRLGEEDRHPLFRRAGLGGKKWLSKALLIMTGVLASISNKRIYVWRMQLAAERVVSAICIQCALTVRRTIFLIACAQQRF